MKTLRTLLLASALTTASLTALAGAVDINTADAEALATALDGVGLTKAEAIITYREANGPFISVDDLAKVKGIGAATVDRNRKSLSVGGGGPRTAR